MFESEDRYVLKHKNAAKIKISILDWQSNVIKLQSTSKSRLLEKASRLSEKWLNYENKELEIIPFTGDTRHAAVTPIVMKRKRKYIMYIVLRNNRTNAKYPTGIFHAHPEYHNIKKEGIGLIEQMGTFILPARLKTEFALIEELFYQGESKEKMLKDHEKVVKHKAFIDMLFEAKPKQSDYEKFSREYMTNVCERVLENTACFKDDEKSQASFEKFLVDALR